MANKKIIELIQFTSHNNADEKISPRLQSLTVEKFERLKRYADNIISIRIHFKVEKLRHVATAVVHLPGKQITARGESEDMYKSVDDIVEKLRRQLDDYRDKQTQHR